MVSHLQEGTNGGENLDVKGGKTPVPVAARSKA